MSQLPGDRASAVPFQLPHMLPVRGFDPWKIMKNAFLYVLVSLAVAGCLLQESPPEPNQGYAGNMSRIDAVMGALLETWDKRYAFKHDRQNRVITLEVPGFMLTVTEDGDGDDVALIFEEAGKKHKAVCSTAEAPKIIEALLFPQ